jgi:hypothetical protein
MSPQELQKRNEKAQQLRVIGVDDDIYFVESSEGKICYRVTFTDAEESCTCADFVRNIKKNSDFKCKHILSVMGCLDNDSIVNGNVIERRTPKLNEQFLITIEGKDFVKYPGLLDLGHQKGISSIEVEILQIPTKENGNFAICKAVVVSKLGETFSDIGDANPQNCNSKVAKHLLRMASTRSIARALRSFTNIGMTCLEELGDLKDIAGDNKSWKPKTAAKKKAPVKSNGKDNTENDSGKKKAPEKTKPASEKNGKKDSKAEDKHSGSDLPKMSSAQKRAIYNLSRRRGISVEELEKMALESFQVKLEDLTTKHASGFIRTLQTAA